MRNEDECNCICVALNSFKATSYWLLSYRIQGIVTHVWSESHFSVIALSLMAYSLRQV